MFIWLVIQQAKVQDKMCVPACKLDKKEPLARKLTWVIVQCLWLLWSVAGCCQAASLTQHWHVFFIQDMIDWMESYMENWVNTTLGGAIMKPVIYRADTICMTDKPNDISISAGLYGKGLFLPFQSMYTKENLTISVSKSIKV